MSVSLGYLRDAFARWVDEGQPDVVTVKDGVTEEDWPIEKVLEALCACTDPLPMELTHALSIAAACSYAIAARHLLRHRQVANAAAYERDDAAHRSALVKITEAGEALRYDLGITLAEIHERLGFAVAEAEGRSGPNDSAVLHVIEARNALAVLRGSFAVAQSCDAALDLLGGALKAWGIDSCEEGASVPLTPQEQAKALRVAAGPRHSHLGQP